MKKLLIWFFVLFLSACQTQDTPNVRTPAPNPEPTATQPALPALEAGESPILISEIMAGKQGNNNYEFIELFNRGDEVVDLLGWALWYRLPTSQEDLFIIRWTTSTWVAPGSHYLLVLDGTDLGLRPDATYAQPLNLTGGGLQLRQMDGKVRDQLGWGKAPEDFYAGQPVPHLKNGQSLERKPGNSLGNFQDSGNNSQDFTVLNQPAPQNSSSPLTPLPAQRLEVRLEAPETAAPGEAFEYILKVTNLTSQELEDVVVTLPVPAKLAVPDLPTGISLEITGSPAVPIATWQVGKLAKEEQRSASITVVAPYTYFTAEAKNYAASAANWSETAYGGIVQTEISGGVIPIGTARTLLNAEMTIEGIASMYTGGYYAGTGNNKFYLQDETGGIQVQVFTGQGSVAVGIGDRVRVRGEVSVYRGSVQIVPINVPDDVQVIERAVIDPEPTQAGLAETQQEASELPGRLVAVEGEIIRVDEFSYSYEIELLDPSPDASPTLTLYVDKQTNINVEEFVPGQQLKAVGILDLRDTATLLYPRRQTDLEERYPPILRIEANAPLNVQAGAPFTVTLAIHNHLLEPAAPVVVTVAVPENTVLETIFDGGSQSGTEVRWELPAIPPNDQAQVSFQLKAILPAPDQENIVELAAYRAAAPQASEAANGQPFYTFIGEGVPIWAIQGSQNRSPYTGRQVSTSGVITGIFPGLGGFFIQETNSDADASTSAGIFVRASTLTAEDLTEQLATLALGDLVEVNGKVREPSQQTVIDISGLHAVTLQKQGVYLPQPVPLDPPVSIAEALLYYESLEGMFVTIDAPAQAVSPINKYGETALVLSKHEIARLYQGEENGILIVVDDGASVTYTDGNQLPYQISTGDQVTHVTGPLAYTYGQYKIEPVEPLKITPGATASQIIQPVADNEYSLMTWNVENLFDPAPPHPTDPPMPRLAEYQVHLDKVASTIEAAGFPIIIGLQEVENIRVLNDLAAHPLLVSFGYETTLIEGDDSRGIDVGYLVRSDQATILDVQARPAPEGLFSRPPLVLHLEVSTSDGEVQLYVLNNHFVSMSGGEEATEPRRTAQAKWNVTLVEEILETDPQALVAVIGDLNSFFVSAPIQALRDGGLVHAFDTLPPQERYTYIFEGESEVLDHILLNPMLMAGLARVEVLRVNADYPLAAPDDTSPQHKSDHDPVIATFTIP